MRKADFGAAMALAIALALGACSPFSAPPRETQDLNYSTLAAMRDSADRIVRLRLDAAADHRIVDPMNLDELELLTYRSFTVLESFKGSADAGDPLHLATPVDLRFADAEGPVPLEFGREYLLFLKGRARDSQYPIQYGGTIWTLNGEPALAVVEGGQARFLRRSDRADFASAVEAVALDQLR